MSPRAHLDLDALLAPTLEVPPCGRSVRYEGDHDRIRAARRAESPYRPQGVWQHEPKRADWDAVIAEARATLTERSKDLQVAAWLVEALVERHGFEALAPSLAFLEALLDRHWPGLFPALDGEDGSDVEARLAPLYWLDDRLPLLVRRLPLTAGDDRPGLSFTDYANARRLERVRLKDAAAAAASEERGALTLAAFDEALKRTPSARLQVLDEQLRAAERVLEDLARTADRLAGREAPSFRALGAALEEARAVVTVASPAPTIEPAPQRRAPRSGRPPRVAPVDEVAITNREQARAKLEEVAAYLQAAEPQAPMRFLVERALDWWDRPLHELLNELDALGDAGAVLAVLAQPWPEPGDER